MKLKQKEKHLKPVQLRIKCPGEIHQNLTDYAEYYAITYKDSIEHSELALLMIEQFMLADSGFKAWRRGQEEPEQKPAKPNGSSDKPSFSMPDHDKASHDRQ